MATQQQNAKRTEDTAGREARAHRILDAAGELILRWGYNKTTIDDIAKQAGVAKGTIYLHWKTRDALFTALMRREKVAMNQAFLAGLRQEPAAWSLRAIFRQSALALLQRPLLKAVLLLDMDVIGKMVHAEHAKSAYAERLAVFMTYLEFLRDHGLVRTDQSLQHQVYLMSAIFMGFFVVGPLLPGDLTPSNEELAELMGDAIHRTLESGRPVSAEEDQTILQALMQYVNQAVTVAKAELEQAIAA